MTVDSVYLCMHQTHFVELLLIILPTGNNQRERPPREKRLRRSPPVDIPPGPRGMPRPGRPDTRRGPMETSGKPQVSSTTPVKSKDPMKMVGQKSNIKLTLISKVGHGHFQKKQSVIYKYSMEFFPPNKLLALGDSG